MRIVGLHEWLLTLHGSILRFKISVMQKKQGVVVQAWAGAPVTVSADFHPRLALDHIPDNRRICKSLAAENRQHFLYCIGCAGHQ